MEQTEEQMSIDQMTAEEAPQEPRTPDTDPGEGMQPAVPETATSGKPRTNSEAFTMMVMREFKGSVGRLELTDYQKQLVQGYFIAIDRMLATAETKRKEQNERNSDHKKYDNTLPYDWNHVDLKRLAIDVVNSARIGLDILQPAMVYAIPFKNNRDNNYQINLMNGYNGIAYIATKYAEDPPEAVTTELIYSTDTFKPIKKDANHPMETYEFAINNPFDRGEIVGGFGYIQHKDTAKNKLIIMTKEDIEKRKPPKASPEFWGGEKKEWDKDQHKSVATTTDGWYAEMCLKTLKRETYSSKNILRDPRKIDDAYQWMKMRQAKIASTEVESRAMKEPIDVPATAQADVQQIERKEPDGDVGF